MMMLSYIHNSVLNFARLSWYDLALSLSAQKNDKNVLYSIRIEKSSNFFFFALFIYCRQFLCMRESNVIRVKIYTKFILAYFECGSFSFKLFSFNVWLLQFIAHYLLCVFEFVLLFYIWSQTVYATLDAY